MPNEPNGDKSMSFSTIFNFNDVGPRSKGTHLEYFMRCPSSRFFS